MKTSHIIIIGIIGLILLSFLIFMCMKKRENYTKPKNQIPKLIKSLFSDDFNQTTKKPNGKSLGLKSGKTASDFPYNEPPELRVSKDVLEQIANRYSPIYLLSKDEKYYPCNLSNLLPWCSLRKQTFDDAGILQGYEIIIPAGYLNQNLLLGDQVEIDNLKNQGINLMQEDIDALRLKTVLTGNGNERVYQQVTYEKRVRKYALILESPDNNNNYDKMYDNQLTVNARLAGDLNNPDFHPNSNKTWYHNGAPGCVQLWKDDGGFAIDKSLHWPNHKTVCNGGLDYATVNPNCGIGNLNNVINGGMVKCTNSGRTDFTGCKQSTDYIPETTIADSPPDGVFYVGQVAPEKANICQNFAETILRRNSEITWDRNPQFTFIQQKPIYENGEFKFWVTDFSFVTNIAYNGSPSPFSNVGIHFVDVEVTGVRFLSDDINNLGVNATPIKLFMSTHGGYSWWNPEDILFRKLEYVSPESRPGDNQTATHPTFWWGRESHELYKRSKPVNRLFGFGNDQLGGGVMWQPPVLLVDILQDTESHQIRVNNMLRVKDFSLDEGGDLYYTTYVFPKDFFDSNTPQYDKVKTNMWLFFTGIIGNLTCAMALPKVRLPENPNCVGDEANASSATDGSNMGKCKPSSGKPSGPVAEYVHQGAADPFGDPESWDQETMFFKTSPITCLTEFPSLSGCYAANGSCCENAYKYKEDLMENIYAITDIIVSSWNESESDPYASFWSGQRGWTGVTLNDGSNPWDSTSGKVFKNINGSDYENKRKVANSFATGSTLRAIYVKYSIVKRDSDTPILVDVGTMDSSWKLPANDLQDNQKCSDFPNSPCRKWYRSENIPGHTGGHDSELFGCKGYFRYLQCCFQPANRVTKFVSSVGIIHCYPLDLTDPFGDCNREIAVNNPVYVSSNGIDVVTSGIFITAKSDAIDMIKGCASTKTERLAVGYYTINESDKNLTKESNLYFENFKVCDSQYSQCDGKGNPLYGNCYERECGDNGTGGNCGTCAYGLDCNTQTGRCENNSNVKKFLNFRSPFGMNITDSMNKYLTNFAISFLRKKLSVSLKKDDKMKKELALQIFSIPPNQTGKSNSIYIAANNWLINESYSVFSADVSLDNVSCMIHNFKISVEAIETNPEKAGKLKINISSDPFDVIAQASYSVKAGAEISSGARVVLSWNKGVNIQIELEYKLPSTKQYLGGMVQDVYMMFPTNTNMCDSNNQGFTNNFGQGDSGINPCTDEDVAGRNWGYNTRLVNQNNEPTDKTKWTYYSNPITGLGQAGQAGSSQALGQVIKPNGLMTYKEMINSENIKINVLNVNLDQIGIDVTCGYLTAVICNVASSNTKLLKLILTSLGLDSIAIDYAKNLLNDILLKKVITYPNFAT